MSLVSVAVVAALAFSSFAKYEISEPTTGDLAYRSSAALIILGQDSGETIFQQSAKQFRELLVNWKFPDSNIVTSEVRSGEELESAIKSFGQKTLNTDRVIVLIISHGTKQPQGPTLLLNQSAPGYEMDKLVSHFKAIPARHRLLILDACQSGSYSKVGGTRTPVGPRAFTESSTAIIRTSAPNRDALIGNTSTKFVSIFAKSAREMEVESRIQTRGLYLSDLMNRATEENADISLAGIEPDSCQMLLNPFPTAADPQEIQLRIPEKDDVLRLQSDIAELKDRITKGGDATSIGYLKLKLAWLLIQRQDPSTTKSNILEAITLLQDKGIPVAYQRDRSFVLASAHLALAPLERTIANYQACISLLIPLLSSQPNVTDTAIMSTLAEAHWKLGEVTGKDSIHRAIHLTETIESLLAGEKDSVSMNRAKVIRGLALTSLSGYEQELGNLRSSVRVFDDVISNADPKSQARVIAWAQNGLGNTYRNLHNRSYSRVDFDKAVKSLESSLETRSKDALPWAWADSNVNIARLRGFEPDLSSTAQASARDIALGRIDESLAIYSRGSFLQSEAWALNIKGIILKAYGDADHLNQAEACLLKSKDLYDQLELPTRAYPAINLLSLANDRLLLSKDKSAKIDSLLVNEVLEAVDHFKKSGNKNDAAWANLELARYLLNAGDLARSVPFAKAAAADYLALENDLDWANSILITFLLSPAADLSKSLPNIRKVVSTFEKHKLHDQSKTAKLILVQSLLARSYFLEMDGVDELNEAGSLIEELLKEVSERSDPASYGVLHLNRGSYYHNLAVFYPAKIRECRRHGLESVEIALRIFDRLGEKEGLAQAKVLRKSLESFPR